MDVTPNMGGIGGGRRIISILFCDVQGSTAAAGQLDPEEWAEVMNGAFELIMKPIYRYEGTVVRLLGDAVLAFFGAPIAREDDPQRAVLAALEIQKAAPAYGAAVQRDWGVSFSVRCGVNTGLVVVGAAGGSQYAEYTAMGDAVNLAARMQQTAQPGTVQISEATYRLVAPFFDVEDLGEIKIKGKDEPHIAYRVLGVHTEPVATRDLAGAQTPLIGRGVEFASLVAAIERLQRGSGGITYLVGEAGLGKSRLIRELRQYTTNLYPNTRWFQTGSFSYERAQPYGQVQRLMRRVCAITGDDSPEERRRKIAHTVAGMSIPDPDMTRQVLEVLLGVAEGWTSSTGLEGEAFRGSLYAAMVPFWQQLAAVHPAVVVFDDMQWADSASAALLEHTLDHIGDLPILMLCAMRPSARSAGALLMGVAERQFGAHLRHITFQPLSRRESELLIKSLLPAGEVPDSMRQEILDKAAGNPLFIEEVVRVIRDGSVTTQDRVGADAESSEIAGYLPIPDNLQTLLTARVDHLAPDVRETLLLASVLGPVIDFRVLARISMREEEVLVAHLRELQDQGLVRETSRTPDLVYRFVHVLLQETAYRMILRRQRRQYHLRVAEALEEIYAGDLDDKAVMLAHHFDRAADLVRAGHYYAKAGEAAFRLYSLKEAITHLGRALELLKQQRPDHITEECKRLYLSKGRALELDSQLEAAQETYYELEALAKLHGDRGLQLAAMAALLPLYSVPTRLVDPEHGRELGEAALQLAQELDDRPAEASVLWNLSNAYALLSELDLATEYGERSVALAQELGLREQMALSLIGLAVFCYAASGKLAMARDALERASAICKETHNLPMLADALSSLAMVLIYAGEFDTAFAHAGEAWKISESIHNLWGQSYSRFKVGVVYWERGDPDRAIDTIMTCLRLGESSGFLASQSEPRFDLAAIYGNLGDLRRAQETLEIARRVPTSRHLPDYGFAIATEAHFLTIAGDVAGAERLLSAHKTESGRAAWPWYHGPLLEAEAEIALALDNCEAAANAASELASELRRYGIRLRLPHALRLYGSALARLGRWEDARKALDEARDEAEAIGSRWMLWQIESALADLETDPEIAARLRNRAREIVDSIARHTSDPSLRRSFLDSPAVTALRAGAANVQPGS